MKKILYAALWLSIFIFWWLSLTHADTTTGQFWDLNRCQRSFDDSDGHFIVEPVIGYDNCSLLTDDKHKWITTYKDFVKKFTIKTGVKAPENMYYFLNNLHYLEEININSLDVSDTTNMGQAFVWVGKYGSCIDTLDISSWKTSKVTNMASLFYESKIKKLVLGSGFDTSLVEDFWNMFWYTIFEEIDLSNFDTSSATSMSYMFAHADYLKKLDVSYFTISDNTYIEGMFKDVGSKVKEGTKITLNNSFKRTDDNFTYGNFYKYDFPTFYYKSNNIWTSIGGLRESDDLAKEWTPVYRVCYMPIDVCYVHEFWTQIDTANITPTNIRFQLSGWTNTANGLNATISIPAYRKSSQEYGAYNNSGNSLQINSGNDSLYLYAQWEAVTTSTGTFGSGNTCKWTFNTQQGSFLIEPATTGTICQLETGSANIWYSIGNRIKSFTISENVKAPKNMGAYFANLSGVEYAALNNLDVSDVNNMKSTFYEFGSWMDTLDLSNWNTSNVEHMWEMFDSTDIKNLILGNNFDTSKVESFSYMFSNSKFSKLALNFTITSGGWMSSMFEDAKNLSELNVSSFDMSNVKNMDSINNMFNNIGADADGRTEILINTWFALVGSSNFQRYKFPDVLYDVYSDSSDETYTWWTLYSGILSNPTYEVILIPIFSVNFDYNYLDTSTNSTGSMTELYRYGGEINTLNVNPIRELYQLVEWTDTPDWQSASIKIPAWWMSQTGYKYTDVSDAQVKLYAQWTGSNNFGSGNSCKWSLESGHFVIEPAISGVICQIKDNGSKDLWLSRSGDITSFTIKPWVKAPANISSFFKGLKLQAIDVKDLDVSDVTNMSQVFAQTEFSGHLNLSGWNTANVTNFGKMFWDSKKIKTLELGNDFDTSSATTFLHMFATTQFEKLVLNFDTSNAPSVLEMFGSSFSLQELDISTMTGSSLRGWSGMFINVGRQVKKWTIIKLNNTFADKVDDLNFPAPWYNLECGNWEVFTYKSGLSSLVNSCVGTVTLTPAYYVFFDYNGWKYVNNMLGTGNIFLPWEEINTAGITPRKTWYQLVKWTDDEYWQNPTITILAWAKSQSGYGANYADVNIKTLYAQWDKYRILSWDNQTYTKWSNTDIVIETNCFPVYFHKLYINNVQVTTGYTIEVWNSGGMNLILKSDHLEWLWRWTYTIKMDFESGDYSITINLTIKDNSNAWGGYSGGWLKKDDCPNGDLSSSYYDGVCEDDNQWDTQGSSDEESEWNQEEKTEFELAYEFAFQHGITTMDTIEKANMTWTLTRIAMAKMLSYYAINVLWQTPDTEKVCSFDDVSSQDDLGYNNWVTLACQLWIMWVWMKNFRPYDTVIRAEFGTALSRMLFGLADWDQYYVTHLARLKSEWIIKNDDPNMVEVRWYTMIMLMRSKK